MSKPIVKAQKVIHRGETRIRLDFERNDVDISKIKSIQGRRWSKTMSAWHLPYTQVAWNALQKQIGDIAIIDKKIKEDNLPPSLISTPEASIIPIKKMKTYYPEPSQSQSFQLPKDAALPKSILENTVHGPTLKILGNKLIVHQWDNFWLQAFVPFGKAVWLEAVKRIPGRMWHPEGKFWFLPFNKETLVDLKDFFKENLILIADKKTDLPEKWLYFPKKTSGFEKLNDVQRKALTALEERLILEGKSHRTIKSYKNHLMSFMLYYPDKKPSSASVKDLERYILYKRREAGIAISTHNSIIGAFNAFYGRVCSQEKKVLKLVRPKKQKKLPNILSKQEVQIFLRSISNIKHKAMFILIYSAGLRRGELLNLRVRDLNKSRACIFIRNAKGGKDRYVMFSKTAQRFVENYMNMHKPRYWLFEGQVRDKYSATSLQDAFEVAKEIAGINPTITIHGLRHSFATHMVDNNVPLHAVQQMLGHASIKTTEIYLHLSEKYLKSIESPLENLDL